MNNKTVAAEREADLKALKVYSLREVQRITGLSYRTLQRCVQDGRLKATKIANKWVVTAAELRRFLEGEPNDEPDTAPM